MKLKNKMTPLALIISGTVSLTACSSVNITKKTEKQPLPSPMQAKIITMNDNTSLKNIHQGNGSSISISNDRYIIGDKSLKWNWHKGSNIIIHDKINLLSDAEASSTWGRKATQVLSFWVYNEKAVDDYMIVDIGRGLTGSTKADAGFKVYMNFTGWRAVGVSLQDDIQGREVEGVGISDSGIGESGLMDTIAGGAKSDTDSIRFTSPSKVKKGTFYIDTVMLSIDDARYQWSDDQVKTRYTIPEIEFNLPKIIPKASSSEVIAANNIKKSLTDVFTSNQKLKGVTRFSNITDLNDAFLSLNIKRNSKGDLSGRHIITGKQKVIYQEDFLKKSDKELFSKYVYLNEYSNIMYSISQYWVESTNKEEKSHLADMYVLMTQHLLDQGFTDGSALVTSHHWGYSSRWWYISAMLMSDVLTSADLRQPVFNSLLWYSREFKANFDMVSGPESSNLDYFNTLSRQHLALIMLEPDINVRVTLLKKFSSYINIALSQTPPGGYDGLRPDGTAWRHEGNYPGYSFPAFNNAAQLVYMLDGTPFAIKAPGKLALKKSIKAAWIYSNPEVGLGLAGRHPFHSPSVMEITDAYKWLALSGDEKTGEKVDKELAGIYLQITGKSEYDSSSIFGEKISPLKLPTGYWSFNGGAFGIQRFNDKMITYKTYNSNVWSSEIYLKNNRYGRYQSHGGVQITPHKIQKEIGYVQEGWDWNRNPGTTTIHLPLEQLNSPIPHTLMLRGDQPFSGTSSLEQKFGMMAFKFKAPSLPTFDSSFSARKTAFSINNSIVMLGSNIKDSTTEWHTETTLFQHAINKNVEYLWVNGEKTTKFPYSATLGDGDWIIDGQGNGYLITSKVKVMVRRQRQVSANDETKKPTKGDFSVAWIDHGTAPSNADYEYQIILDATPEKMKHLSDNYKLHGSKTYNVIKKNSNFHIVKDIKTDVTGYTVFDGGVIDNDIIYEIPQPAIVMTRKFPDNKMVISGGTPDLNMGRYTKAKINPISVILNGKWKATTANKSITINSNTKNTTLTFNIYFGMPEEITLEEVK